MRELLRSNDAVLISFAQSVLRQAGIDSFVADQHMSVVEGSIGAFPAPAAGRRRGLGRARRSRLARPASRRGSSSDGEARRLSDGSARVEP